MPPYQYEFPQRQLVSQENQSMTARPDVPRSKFTGRWSRLTTFDNGQLHPFLVEEILPGDHMRYDVTPLVRMSTPLFPLFSNQQVDTFFFFVPTRLLWTNWQRFMGAQDAPGAGINYTIPQLTMPTGGFAIGGLYDAFGLPTVGQVDAAGTGSVNALPARAYARIYNDWFRDQNLIAIVTQSTDDGPDLVSEVVLQYRAKAHDYFTSCLPWPQKFTAPILTLSGLAPVKGLGIGIDEIPSGGPGNMVQTLGDLEHYDDWKGTATSQMVVRLNEYSTGEWSPDIWADLSQATSGITINELRETFLIQQMFERDARGGTRYTEILKSHFGVTSPDARLQRPEYIGGGTTPLHTTPIAQTTASGGVVGALGGTTTAVGQHRASYAATEHGYIIGIINVRSELAYQQGLHKMWTRSVREDFYWPSLAGLGEQAVLRQELYFRGVPADDATVFGYQERWHEYRQRTSEVTGLFRSTSSGNIDEWHIVQQFGSAPVLGQTFIEDRDDGRMNRVLAAGAASQGMQYIADIHIQRDAVRPIPTFGTPVTLGRF